MKGLVKKIAFVLTIVMLASSASLILACCQPAPKYTIRYVLNGGTMDQSTISLKEGEDIPSAIPTKSGYNFAGWYQSAKFSGSAFEQTTMPAQNIVLYAKWEKQQGTYSITYQLNGGTMGQSSVTLKEGDPIPSVTPTRNGYKFVGWYQSADFSGNKFEDTVMPAQNIELYAKWEKEVVESITFTQEQLDNHNAEIAQYSQDGHLYIHYKRFESTAAEYEKFNLWVWPCSKTGIEFDWMRDKDGNIIVDEMGFVTADIDLTKTYTNAGNSGNVTSRFLNQSACDANFPAGGLKDSANYPKGDETIGFLIVLEESKQAQGHWQSDGGNQYIPSATSKDYDKFADVVRDGGFVHLYATQDMVSNYVYKLEDLGEVSNPYADDDGTNVSQYNVNSSSKPMDKAPSTDTVSGVGYQIMVASFADSDGDGKGDINGIRQKLDYLEALNVDVLWLTPIQLSDSYHGYDIIDYKAVDPKFGTMEDYVALLNEAEQRGMKVIMDLVLNHTSVNNEWFQKSAQLDPQYRSFYQWKNHETTTLSKNWHKYSDKPYSYYGKFATSMPELNYDYQGTRDAIVDVATFWLEKGVDGFRIDAVKHIYMKDEVDASASDIIVSDYDSATKTDYSSNLTKNIHFFNEFNSRVKAQYPDAYIVGENFDGHAYNVAPYYQGLDGMLDFYMYYNLTELARSDQNWPKGLAGGKTNDPVNYNHMVNGNSLYKGNWNFNDVSKAYNYYRGDTAIPGLFTSNHDIARLLNAVNCDPGEVGSNPLSASKRSTYEQKAKIVISTMMTLPGVSFIYYGDELGMSGNYSSGEGKLSPHVDRWYRQPMKWTATPDSFTTGFSISGDKTYVVEWDSYNKTLQSVEEQTGNANSMLEYTRKWTAFKSGDMVIQKGTYSYLQTNHDRIFSYKLTYNGTTYYIYHNFGSNSINNFASGGSQVVIADSGCSTSTIAPYSTVVLK